VNSPVVDGDLVLLSSLFSGWGPHSRPVHRYFAMNKHTGVIQWWSDTSGAPLDTTYSVPVIATLDGQRVLLAGMADGNVIALHVHTGKVLWKYELSKRGLNASPVYADGRLYISHSEENHDTIVMGRVVCLNARTGEELWRQDGIPAGYASPIYTADDMLIVPDNSANLHAFDGISGKKLWEFNYGKEGKGSPLYADGKIYVGEVAGHYHILEANRAGCDRLHTIGFALPNGSPMEIFATPVAAHGRVILPNLFETWCISTQPASLRTPNPEITEPALAPPGDIVSVLVHPGEVRVRPGEAITYTLMGYDAKGNPVRPVAATWGAKGLKGTWENSVFTTQGPRFQGGVIEAEAPEGKAAARLRIVPDLPYEEDFESLEEGSVPPGWIASNRRTVVETIDGNKVFRKLADNPSPPFARIRGFTLPAVEGPHTVQADMLGQHKRNRFMPDMGLMNSGYKGLLIGTSETTRRLRIVAWAAMPRIVSEIEYDWKPDVWYTMKLAVDASASSEHVKLKVWPRGEPEPAAWNVTLTDPIPQNDGSPGLYAYSTGITSKSPGTEVLFDNLKVTR